MRQFSAKHSERNLKTWRTQVTPEELEEYEL